MTTLRAGTTAPAVAALMRGPVRPARALSATHLVVGGYVVAVTSESTPLMPNGIELPADVLVEDPVLIGGGTLRLGPVTISPGRLWRPRPTLRVLPMLYSDRPRIGPHVLGHGPGETPVGDDVACGYLAAAALMDIDLPWPSVLDLARTNASSATLLAHACRGELPEPAHALIEFGDERPLMNFGQTSGRALWLGLAAAARDFSWRGEPSPEHNRSSIETRVAT